MIIPVPKPQSHHNYCQVCLNNYENFEEHVSCESHLIRAKNQAQLSAIDDIIGTLNEKKSWLTNWKPDPVKVRKNIPCPVFQYKITKEGRIREIYDRPENVASRKAFMQNGRRSGRASAAGIPGKSSKTSLRNRVSAKSSVTRPPVVENGQTVARMVSPAKRSARQQALLGLSPKVMTPK